MAYSLLDYDNGKMKIVFILFGGSLSVLILSFFIIFGIGRTISVSVGITLAVFSLALSLVFGVTSVCGYFNCLIEEA